MVQNGPLLSVALTHSLPWWLWSIASLLRCLSTERRKRSPILPVSSLHLPKHTGKESQREEALILNQSLQQSEQRSWDNRKQQAAIFHSWQGWWWINVELKHKYQIRSAEETCFFPLNVNNDSETRFNPFARLRLYLYLHLFLGVHVQLMTIHVACKNMQVWSNGNKWNAKWNVNVVKSSLLKKPMKVACVDGTRSVFCIPSLPCCLHRNRRPRSGRASRGWYNSHWITQALISSLGFWATTG